jgi:fucose permease
MRQKVQRVAKSGSAWPATLFPLILPRDDSGDETAVANHHTGKDSITVIPLLPAAIAVLLVTGMGLALLGSVKVSLARKLKIDEVRVGGLVSLFGFAMIPVIMAAGYLTDLVGRQAVLTGGGLLMVAALLVLAAARHYATALLAVLLLSAAWSAQINVINVLTPLAFSGITKNEPQAFNLANVFFGMGAFLTPMVIVVMLRKKNLTTALWVLAGLVLISVVFTFSVDSVDFLIPTDEASTNGETEAAPAGFGFLLADRTMWLCAMMLFFYGPVEGAMAAWATTILSEKGVSETTASGLLSGFWLAFMLSRLIAAFTIPAGAETQLILGAGLACVGVLTAVVFSQRKALTIAAVIGAGFVFGPIFPTIMAVLLGHFKTMPDVQGRAVGLLFAIGGIGWTMIPMLIGAYARRTSVQRSFLIAVASAVGLCIVATLLAYSSAS